MYRYIFDENSVNSLPARCATSTRVTSSISILRSSESRRLRSGSKVESIVKDGITRTGDTLDEWRNAWDIVYYRKAEQMTKTVLDCTC